MSDWGNDRRIRGIHTNGRIEIHQTETVRSDQADAVLTDFGFKLLFEQGPRFAGFGKSCGNENHGRYALGGAVVDDGENQMGRDGDHGEIDRVRNGLKRREGSQTVYFIGVGIDGDD